MLIGLPVEVMLWPPATKSPSGEAAIQSPRNRPMFGVTVLRHRNVPSCVYEVTARSWLFSAGPETIATLPIASTAILADWPAPVVPASRPPAVHKTGRFAARRTAPVPIRIRTTGMRPADLL